MQQQQVQGTIHTPNYVTQIAERLINILALKQVDQQDTYTHKEKRYGQGYNTQSGYQTLTTPTGS